MHPSPTVRVVVDRQDAQIAPGLCHAERLVPRHAPALLQRRVEPKRDRRAHDRLQAVLAILRCLRHGVERRRHHSQTVEERDSYSRIFSHRLDG